MHPSDQRVNQNVEKLKSIQNGYTVYLAHLYYHLTFGLEFGDAGSPRRLLGHWLVERHLQTALPLTYDTALTSGLNYHGRILTRHRKLRGSAFVSVTEPTAT